MERMDNVHTVPIWKKLLLTIKEASELSGIGETKLRQIVRDNPNADFVVMNGTKYLIKRSKLESLCEEIDAI